MRANRFGKLCQIGLLAWSAAVLFWLLNELPTIASSDGPGLGLGLLLLASVWHLGAFYLLVLFLVFGRHPEGWVHDRDRSPPIPRVGEIAGLGAGVAGIVLFAALLQGVVGARPSAQAAISVATDRWSLLSGDPTRDVPGLAVRVERFWEQVDGARALVSIVNDSDARLRYVDVRCVASDASGESLGTGDWSVGPIEPRGSTLTSVPVPLFAGGLDRIRCGLTAAHPNEPDA